MVETPSALSPSSPRKPRLLWACPWCLLDTSSGASISARQMLLQLVEQGYEVAILGATIFDAEKGVLRLREHWEAIETNRKKFIKINDGPLTHTLLVTKSTVRNDMTAEEEGLWYGGYVSVLNDFKPDLVWFYGGQTLDMLIPDEARMRGIPSVAYLVNGNYQSTRWCRDVDLIVTDTQATADLYKETQGFTPVAIGAFIEPSKVIAPEHRRERVLFVNPSFAKGVGIVVQLALLLRDRRPDILFEVVESRGDWPEAVKLVSASMGQPCEVLENVILTPNTDDMRPIYGRARILLAPSLWWESGARVLAEAMLNAIPAIVTDRGGSPEMIQNGGIKLVLPENCHASPYTTVPALELLQPLVDKIIQLYDDEVEYEKYVARAQAVGQNRHALAVSTGRLLQTFAPLIQKRAGDGVINVPGDKVSKQTTPTTTPSDVKSVDLKVCDVPRDFFYKVMDLAFKQLSRVPYVAEVGVLRGGNAKQLYETLQPAWMWLVDPWKAYHRFHYPFDERPFYIAPESSHDGYFGGSVYEQSTFDKIFESCKEKFEDFKNVTIIREDSIAGLETLKSQLKQMDEAPEKIDLLYIDGDHAYEYVLRDLMYWEKVIAPDGAILLNDCCFSPAGAAQNLGVLEAVTSFIKRTDFIPVLLNNSDFTDVVLVRRASRLAGLIDSIMNDSNVAFVNVPHQMLASMRITYGKQRVNVSFC